MSRLLIPAAVILVVLVGGMILLAGRSSERPLARVEKVVSLESLQK